MVPPSYRIYFKFPKIGGASGSTKKFPHVKLSELWPPEQHCGKSYNLIVVSVLRKVCDCNLMSVILSSGSEDAVSIIAKRYQ